MPIDSVIYSYIEGHENYPDKAVIIEENAKGDWVYVVLKGQVKVIKKTPKGLVTVYTLKEGDIFGEVALFGRRRGIRTATIVADGPVEIAV
ncbi:MAG: cyclic nucleotide-binding domain-containing protein, partial [Desulfatiglandales bacterium]